MARDPGSVWAPLPEAGAPDGMVKDAVIVHSTGDNGTAAGTRRFFELAGTVTESTFIVGWGPEDPTLQIMDSTDIADANVSANRRAIAIEVVGDGKGGYNAWQRSELIRVLRWCMATHPNIAARICRTATDAGLGWHVMFGAPGPWAAVAKICPGPVRIQELKDDIFPTIFAGGAGEDEFDVTVQDDVKDIVAALGAANAAAQKLPTARTVLAVQWDIQAALTKAIPLILKGSDVDEKAIIEGLRPVILSAVVPAVLEALPAEVTGGAGIDEERLAAITEQVFRRVLGQLDETPSSGPA